MAERKSTKNTSNSKKRSTLKAKKRTASNKKSTSENSGLSPQTKAIIYAASAALLLAFIIIKGQNVWSAIRGVMFGIFGFVSLLLPLLFIFLTYINVKEQQLKHKTAKLWLSIGIILCISILFFLFDEKSNSEIGYFTTLKNLFTDGYNSNGLFSAGGGVLSGILGYPLYNALGSSGSITICIIILVALVLIVTGVSISDIILVAKKPVKAVAAKVSDARQNSRDKIQKHQAERQDYIPDEDELPPLFNENYNKSTAYSNERIDIKLDKSEKNKKQKLFQNTTVEIPDDDGVAVEKTAAEKFREVLDKVNSGETPKTKQEVPTQQENDPPVSVHPFESKFEGTADADDMQSEAKENDDFEDGKAEEEFVVETKAEANPLIQYNYPPVQLLKLSASYDDTEALMELQENANKLITTLKSFGVGASIINICRGPSVTRYEIQPAPGVKISKITNLVDDIALNLAAGGIRIEAPIPGKAAVGIEVPNKNVTMVSMRELIDSDEFRKGKSKLTCVLGKDISGNIVATDLSKMPHLLIAGTTGSGKSVCVNSILLSILYKATPDEVKLLLIDPKMVEFSKYKSIPHLLVPIVSDAKKAAGALNWAVSEMLQRYKLFSEYDCKEIHSYNKLIDANLKFIQENSTDEEERCMEINGLPVSKEKMPQIVIAIDEFADLMMAAPSEVEEAVCRLAQMARAAGMHLLIATQRPTVNVITGLIKSNIPSRIALKVSSQMDSRTILDFGGAEKLIGRGDMLFAPVGASKPLRVQGCYASDEEIENVTGYIKKNYNAHYNAEIEEKIRKIAAEEINNSGKKEQSQAVEGNDLDVKMDEAIKCVLDAGQASTSLLQRKIKVGYARAGRMIDDMEQMGIVGPYQGSKPREVLITYNDWLERNHILGDSVNSAPTDDEE